MDYVGIPTTSVGSYSYSDDEGYPGVDGSIGDVASPTTPNGGVGISQGGYEYLDFAPTASGSTVTATDTGTLEDFLGFMGSEASAASFSFQEDSTFQVAGPGSSSHSEVDYDVVAFASGGVIPAIAPERVVIPKRVNRRADASHSYLDVTGTFAQVSSLVTEPKSGPNSVAAPATGAAAARRTSDTVTALRRKSSQQDLSENYDPFKDFGFSKAIGRPTTSGEGRARKNANRRGSGAAPRPANGDAFAFGIDAFMHGLQLGFGRQPSFKRVTPDSALKGDYFYQLGVIDESPTAREVSIKASPREATATARRQYPDSGLSVTAPAADGDSAVDPLRQWIDTYQGSPLVVPTTPAKVGANFRRQRGTASPPPDASLALVRVRQDTSSFIHEDFQREIDFLMKNLVNTAAHHTDTDVSCTKSGKPGSAATEAPFSSRWRRDGSTGTTNQVGVGDATRDFVGFSGSAAFPLAPVYAGYPGVTRKEPVKAARPLGAGSVFTRSPVATSNSTASKAPSAQNTPGGGLVMYTPAAAQPTPAALSPGKRRHGWGPQTPSDELERPGADSAPTPRRAATSAAKKSSGAATPSARAAGGGKAGSGANRGRATSLATPTDADAYQYWDDAWLKDGDGGTSQATTPGPVKSLPASLPSAGSQHPSSPAFTKNQRKPEATTSTVPAPPASRTTPPAGKASQRECSAPPVSNTAPGRRPWPPHPGNNANLRRASIVPDVPATTANLHTIPNATSSSPSIGSILPSPPPRHNVSPSDNSVSKTNVPPTLRGSQPPPSPLTLTADLSNQERHRPLAVTDTGRLPRLPRPISAANCVVGAVAPIVPTAGRYHTAGTLRVPTSPRDTSGAAPAAKATSNPTTAACTDRHQARRVTTPGQPKGGPLLEPLPSSSEPENQVSRRDIMTTTSRVATGTRGGRNSSLYAGSGPPPIPTVAGGALHRSSFPRSSLDSHGKPSPATSPSEPAPLANRQRRADETDAHIDYLLYSIDEAPTGVAGVTNSSSDKAVQPSSDTFPTHTTAAVRTGAKLSHHQGSPTATTALQWHTQKPASVFHSKGAASGAEGYAPDDPSQHTAAGYRGANRHTTPSSADPAPHLPSRNSLSASSRAAGQRRADQVSDERQAGAPTSSGTSPRDRSLRSTSKDFAPSPTTPASAGRRRRLSEFKTGGCMYPSFSGSKRLPGQDRGSGTTNTGNQADTTQLHEEAQRATQRANEERKQRIQAFMARRKAEKEVEELRRLSEEEKANRRRRSEESVQGKLPHEALTSSTDTAAGVGGGRCSGSASTVRSSRKSSAGAKRKTSANGIAPSIPTDLHTTIPLGGHTTTSNKTRGPPSGGHRNRVRTLVVCVSAAAETGDSKTSGGSSIAQGSVDIVMRDSTTIEVLRRNDRPQLFNVDEHVKYTGEAQQRLPSSILLELNRRFCSGMNGAVLLASTKNARPAATASVSHVVETAVMHMPPRSELYMSMALVRGGQSQDLFVVGSAPSGKSPTCENIGFRAMPLVGVTLEGVGFVKITGIAQVKKLMAAGYHYALPYIAGGPSADGIVVMNLVLKQLPADGDVVLSSLLVSDVGTNARSYEAVLQRAGNSPYQLFHGALGGPSFTVALFCVSTADGSDTLPALAVQQKLSHVANRQTHTGSIRRFVSLVENEVQAKEGTPAADSSKHKKLREQLLLGNGVLADPAHYKPGDTPERTSRRLGAPLKDSIHEKHTSGRTDAAIPGNQVSRPHPAPKDPGPPPPHGSKGGSKAATPIVATRASPTMANSLSEAAVRGSGTNTTADKESKFKTVAGSERYANRSKQQGPPQGFIQLDDEDSVADAKPSPLMKSRLPEPTLVNSSGSGRIVNGAPPLHTLPSTATRPTGSRTANEDLVRRRSGSGQFLAGAATIGVNGPAWPSAPVLQPPAPPEALVAARGDRSNRDKAVIHRSSSFQPDSRGSTRDNESRDSVNTDGVVALPSVIPASTKVRTMVLIDPKCSETSNVTFDNTVVIATGEDDFEEYEVDEVSELAAGSEVVVSGVLEELCDTVLKGCNAALLGADSRPYSVSVTVLKSAVATILRAIADGGGSKFGSLTASVVKLKGETVMDLLTPQPASPEKLFIAISPIFGPCVHGVESRAVTGARSFESMLNHALTRAAEHDRDHSLIFVSIILKLRVPETEDVVACSLVASLAGENVGLYTAVLDRSSLVPHALFHYALGGPCYTVALLGIGSGQERANTMLQVQHRLGEISNRPTHPGSIIKFLRGLRQDLLPVLTEKLRLTQDTEERARTNTILMQLEEMAADAELLLKDFEHHEPKAYLHGPGVGSSNEATPKAPANRHDSRAGPQSAPANTDTTVPGAKKQRGPLPRLSLKSAASADDESLRTKSLVYFHRRLMGGGALAVDGNSVLASTTEGGRRFDHDEVIVCEGSTASVPDSNLLDVLTLKFATGHNTGLLAADSSSCASTPMVLRKIAYQVVAAMGTVPSGEDDTYDVQLVQALGNRRIVGELHVSMALIKDNITADLLPVETDAPLCDFEIEHSPVFGPRIRGVTSHYVKTTEDFDRFLAIAIDNAGPALETADPGIMVVSLTLTQKTQTNDVYVSSLVCTTVFDAVHHYFNVLDRSPLEPLELFRNILGGTAWSVAMAGVSDEDTDSINLLSAMVALSRVQNLPTQPNSVTKHIHELQEMVAKLADHAVVSSSEEEKQYNLKRLEVVRWILQNAEALLRNPFAQEQEEEEHHTFVPLGAPEMTSVSAERKQ